MSHTLFDHIPNRMHSKLALANFYVPSKHRPKVLALTTDRRLFELNRKEIDFEIDLSQTVLKDVIVPTSPQQITNDLDSTNVSQLSQLESDKVQFGKYFAYEGYNKRLFILVKVFDKLVVIERNDNGFKFIKEYSNVDRFDVTDPESNYRAVVAIHFLNSPSPVYETFLEPLRDDQPTTSKAAVQPCLDENLHLLTERISHARAELAMQQVATRKQFVALKDQLMFGPDIMRSDALEEKQPLGKYGDIWMKIAGEFLVIGIPVINNCSRR